MIASARGLHAAIGAERTLPELEVLYITTLGVKPYFHGISTRSRQWPGKLHMFLFMLSTATPLLIYVKPTWKCKLAVSRLITLPIRSIRELSGTGIPVSQVTVALKAPRLYDLNLWIRIGRFLCAAMS